MSWYSNYSFGGVDSSLISESSSSVISGTELIFTVFFLSEELLSRSTEYFFLLFPVMPNYFLNEG